MKHFVIFNPGSKDGKSQKKIALIMRLLRENKIDFDHKLTEKLEDAYYFSRAANQQAYDVIIAVGGDGTINNVINGFFDKNGRRISKALFGVIYTGTSPDFCKSYHIALKINEAIRIIKDKNYQSVKLGKITFAANKPAQLKDHTKEQSDCFTTKYFACCANIGLGATLAAHANSGIRKLLGDFLGTFCCLIKTLFIYKPRDYEIIVDHKKRTIKKLFNLSIGKTYYIASGIKVKNNLNQLPYKFYLLTINKLKLSRLLAAIIKIYSGRQFQNDQSIDLCYCNQIEILGNCDQPEVEFDGDPAGFLPCKIEETGDCIDILCKSEA